MRTLWTKLQEFANPEPLKLKPYIDRNSDLQPPEDLLLQPLLCNHHVTRTS